MNDFDKDFQQNLNVFNASFERKAAMHKSDWSLNALPTTNDLVTQLNKQLAYEHEYQKNRTDELVKYMIKNMVKNN